MRLRHGWIVLAAMVALAVAALVVAGGRAINARTFTLGTPALESVALLDRSRHVCEGPVTASGPSQAVGIWGASLVGPAKLTVDVREVGAPRSLGVGSLHASTAAGEYLAHLGATVPAGRPVRICLTGTLNTFMVLGSGASPGIVTTGVKPGQQFSLVLFNDRHSLLGSLPTAFSRATLFKPSWVGSWTFWLLAVALLATFGLGGIAIAAAAAADEAGDPGASAEGG